MHRTKTLQDLHWMSGQVYRASRDCPTIQTRLSYPFQWPNQTIRHVTEPLFVSARLPLESGIRQVYGYGNVVELQPGMLVQRGFD